MINGDSKTKNECINFFKGLACIFVVTLHIKFPVDIVDNIVQCLARFAVPLFFMISGFFCYYSDISSQKQKIKNKIKHILHIILWSEVYAFISYLGVNILGSGNHNVKNALLNIISPDGILKLLIFNLDPVLSILWFLWSLLYCYLFFLYYRKIEKTSYNLLFIATTLTIHFILGNFMSGILGISINVELYRNAWFMGIPLFLIGYELRKNAEIVLRFFSQIRTIELIVLGNLIALIEWFIVRGRQQMYLGSILVAIGCIIYSCLNPKKIINKRIVYIGEYLSLFVYVMHISMGIILEKIFKVLNVTQTVYFQYSKQVLVIALTILVAYIFNILISTVRNYLKKI